MAISVILTDFTSNLVDTVNIENVKNNEDFSYFDNENNECHMSIFEDGLCLLKKCKDHNLELNLRNKAFAKISTLEGTIELDVKVVDFILQNGILVMRYIINEEMREIKVICRS